MSNELLVLAGTAAFLGFIHTVFGPDHYVPFIALSKARNWSSLKTALVTFLCGIGHVLSSIILGFLGIFFGVAVLKLKIIESFRGEIAVWFLLIFGFLYFVWGINKALRSYPHKHHHPHETGELHSHTHTHTVDHAHPHMSDSEKITPWILFVIFIFGPCEPLIPLVMYPAAKLDILSVVVVSFVFGFATILTMLFIVLTSYFGLSKLPFYRIEKYSHALAGLAIFLCGFAVKLLGL